MQYQQTPQGLSTMFNSDVSNGGGSIAATPAMMGLWAQQQHADDMTAQDQQRQLNYNNADDPLKLQRSGLDNQQLQAQIPGEQARSSMAVRQNSNQAVTNDAQIANTLSGLNAKTANNHIDETNALGTRLSQMAVEARGNPMGAAARIKAELTNQGHGDLYNSDWDTANPLDMAKDLEDTGQKIQDTSSRFRSALQLRELQNQGLAYRANATVEAAKIRAAAALQSIQDTNNSRMSIAERKQTVDQKIADFTDRALAAADPEERKTYIDALTQLKSYKVQLQSASAGVTTGAKPSMPGMGVPSNDSWAASHPPEGTPTPPFNGAQPDQPAAPAAVAAPTAPAAAVPGWPAGAVAQPDGSIMFGGKLYRKKK